MFVCVRRIQVIICRSHRARNAVAIVSLFSLSLTLGTQDWLQYEVIANHVASPSLCQCHRACNSNCDKFLSEIPVPIQQSMRRGRRQQIEQQVAPFYSSDRHSSSSANWHKWTETSRHSTTIRCWLTSGNILYVSLSHWWTTNKWELVVHEVFRLRSIFLRTQA